MYPSSRCVLGSPVIVCIYPRNLGGRYTRSLKAGAQAGLGGRGTALDEVDDGEDDACDAQGGEGEEGDRLGVR